MFGLYFGDYLLKNGLVSKEALDRIIFHPYPELMNELIAMKCFAPDEADGIVTTFQEKSNLSDQQMEAIKSGDLEKIIPAFVHFDASADVEKNLKAYQEDNDLSDEEMERLKSETDVDLLIPQYVLNDPQYYNRYVSLMLKYLISFISKRILIKPVYTVQEYEFECLAYQQLKGAQHIFVGFSGRGSSLLVIARAFGKKDFTEVDEEVCGTVCELINCLNGLFASEVSYENVELDIALPHFCSDQMLVSNGMLFCIPLVIDNEEVDLIISQNTEIEII